LRNIKIGLKQFLLFFILRAPRPRVNNCQADVSLPAALATLFSLTLSGKNLGTHSFRGERLIESDLPVSVRKGGNCLSAIQKRVESNFI
jgi:hypothetical protein